MIDDMSGLSNGGVYFCSPSSCLDVVSGTFSGLSGTLDTTFTRRINIPQEIEPGMYKLNWFQLWDISGNNPSYTSNDFNNIPGHETPPNSRPSYVPTVGINSDF